MVGEPWHQEFEAAGHVASAMGSEVNASPPFILVQVIESESPAHGMALSIVRMDLPIPTQSRNLHG